MDGITLTLNADTATASENLSRFFGQLQASLDRVSAPGAMAGMGQQIRESSAATSESLSQLRHTSMLTREAFHGLEATTRVLGGSSMPMLAQGIMAGRMALMSLRGAAAVTGIAVGTLAPVLGLVGVAIVAGIAAWRGYTGETEKAAKSHKELMESMSKLPGMLGQVNDLLKARRLSAEAANEYADYLTGKKKMYRSLSGGLTRNPTEMPEGTETSATLDYDFAMGTPAQARPLRPPQKPVGLPEASMTEVQDWVKQQLEGKGGMGDTSIEAINKLRELEKQQQEESLSGLRKEEAEIHIKYEKEREEIQKTLDQAKLSMTPKEAEAGAAALDLSKRNEASAIQAARFKDEQEKEKQAAEAFVKRKEELATEAKTEQERLERELTLLGEQEGEKRGQNYARQYAQRMKLAESQYYAGEIGEAEYTRLVEEATIKRLEARRREAEEAIRLQKLQEENARKQFELQEELIKSDPYSSELEKAEALLPIWQKQSELVQKQLALVQAQLAQPGLSEADRAKLTGQQLDLQRQGAGISDKIAGAQDQTSFSGQFKQVTTSLKNEWGSFASQTANAFKSVFESAIASISKGITGLIMGTMTWAQALRSIASTILTTVVEAIVQMGVRWVMTQIMMMVAGRAMAAASSAALIPIALAQSAIWAAPAALATMATDGEAAAAAPGQVAIGVAITQAEAMAAFSQGGYTGQGTGDELAGLVHRNEFVFSAPAVRRLGLGSLQALHEGSASGASGTASGGAVNHIHVWAPSQDAEMRRFIESTAGAHTIVNTVAKNAHRFR